MAAPIVLSKPQHQVPFVEVSAPDPLHLVPSQGLLVARRVEERHVSSLVHLVHLENLSTATSKWVKSPGALFNGPTRSSPHMANGHVIGMVCRAWAGRCVFRA